MDHYFIRNKEAGYLGNSPVWWGMPGGYTAYVENARRFTKEEAADLVKMDPNKFSMHLCEFIEHKAHMVFDSQDFHLEENWRKP